jgi:BirA family biotin operon repressor/biotin-[acetyl-CoA-carboxylase] ligase
MDQQQTPRRIRIHHFYPRGYTRSAKVTTIDSTSSSLDNKLVLSLVILQQNRHLAKYCEIYRRDVHAITMNLTPRHFCDTFGRMENTEAFTGEAIARALTTACLGHPVHYWPQVDSTMDQARRLAEMGPDAAPDGTLVVADQQTAGRGRLQRSWWSPAASSLLISLILRPLLFPHHAQCMTMVCSLAVCEAIDRVSGLEARVKWPNDVLIGGRKTCGILTELDVLGEQINYAIVGIGINVNVDFGGAPPMMAPATSLKVEIGRTVSRMDLLVTLLECIEVRYLALQNGDTFHAQWARQMATLGQHVEISSGAERWSGLATGVDPDGALLLRTEDGHIQRILAGDVSLHLSGDRA